MTTNENSAKNKSFTFLDANASVLNTTQLREELVNQFNVTKGTANAYLSAWRKQHGVQRRYQKRAARFGKDAISPIDCEKERSDWRIGGE